MFKRSFEYTQAQGRSGRNYASKFIFLFVSHSDRDGETDLVQKSNAMISRPPPLENCPPDMLRSSLKSVNGQIRVKQRETEVLLDTLQTLENRKAGGMRCSG